MPWCRTGRHYWSEPLDATRCCSGEWRRALRMRGDEQDLDSRGRRIVCAQGRTWVAGWLPAAAATERTCDPRASR
jgi:hypothetical protein